MLGFYEPSRDAGLWGVAEKLAEGDIDYFRDSEEAIGAKSLSFDPAYISTDAALQLDFRRIGQKMDFSLIERLATILTKTTEIINKDPLLSYRSLITLYNSLRTYPDLVDLQIKQGTTVDEVVDTVTDKTKWIAQELVHARELPRGRLRNLMHFCCKLSEEIQSCSNPFVKRLAG